MKRLLFAAALVGALLNGRVALATGYTDIGTDIAATPDAAVDVSGYFRARGELLGNLDLDRGLTPDGAPLYPVPLADPTSQILTHSDFRLRTDVAAYAGYFDAAVKARVDVLDNLSPGSMPEGPPQSTVSQEPIDVLAIRRAYAEVIVPFGLLAVGRVGAHFGTGMLINSGDCADCDSGDAADRIALITPLVDHIFGVAYDVGFVGPQAVRPGRGRVVDIDPSDDVRGLSFAVLKYRTPRAVLRRLAVDRATLDYGAVVSYRWQKNDVPAYYLPTTEPVPLDERQVIERGLRAFLTDAYIDFTFPFLRLRAEAAYVTAVIEEPSLIPGVRYGTPLTSDQWGGVIESRVGHTAWPVGFGLDAGVASGDAAYGFGANPGPLEGPSGPGEIDGQQADLPYDTTVDNFRFHPDYHVDKILFREIIGTVTDAVYVRPHVDLVLGHTGGGAFLFDLAAIASWAVEPTSTPSGQRHLGVEIDPSIRYLNGRFLVAAEYALLLPGAAFDNPDAGLGAKPAQLARIRMNVGF